jgi:hypothetical protein
MGDCPASRPETPFLGASFGGEIDLPATRLKSIMGMELPEIL